MDIDRFLPEYDFVERHHIRVDAPPERVYQAVRDLDLTQSRVIRTLFALRGISAARTRGIPGLLDFGFVLLSDRAPHELVLGLAGRFWRVRGDIRRLEPEAFADWAEDGYAKVVWSFHVAQETARSTRLSTETRIQCIGPRARLRFGLYWRMVAHFSGWTRREMLRLIKTSAEDQAA